METEPIRFYDCKDAFGELANFYQMKKKEGKFEFEGKLFATTEHYYQCKKFDYEGAPESNAEYAKLIQEARTPNISFCLANQVCNSRYPWAKPIRETIKKFEDSVEMDPMWLERRLEVMYVAVHGKFTQSKRLRDFLLATGERELIEHTHRDDFWADGGDGSGENHLGKILMRVRAEIRAEKVLEGDDILSMLGKRKKESKPQRKEKETKRNKRTPGLIVLDE